MMDVIATPLPGEFTTNVQDIHVLIWLAQRFWQKKLKQLIKLDNLQKPA
jgi:hypothetical protein